MTAFNPALAARIAATGVPLSADWAPLSTVGPSRPTPAEAVAEALRMLRLYITPDPAGDRCTVPMGAREQSADYLRMWVELPLTQAEKQLADLAAENERLRDEVDGAREYVAFLNRATLPDLRRAAEGHKAGKERWRKRAEAAEARIGAVLDLCDREERNAMRWENPLPVPDWVAPVQRAALGDDKRTGAAR